VPCGPMDRHDEANNSFSHFVNAPGDCDFQKFKTSVKVGHCDYSPSAPSKPRYVNVFR
jgi:hypothetical protein